MEYTEETYWKTYPNLSREIFFKNEQEFEEFMVRIDSKMISENIPIKGRQVKGLCEAAMALKTEIPWVENSFAKKNDYSILSLSAHISIWFQKKYGNLLNMGYANKSIIKLNGDYYIINIPGTYGEPEFYFDPNEVLSQNENINIAKCIEGLTGYVINKMSKHEIVNIAEQFYNLIYLTQRLEQLINIDMIKEIKSDFMQSVETFFRDSNVSGLSKWHSLQFSEKILKIFINYKKGTYSYTHKLNMLLEKAKTCGLKNHVKFNIEIIQCEPEVRYNSALVSNEEAYNAHIESIKLAINTLNQIEVDL